MRSPIGIVRTGRNTIRTVFRPAPRVERCSFTSGITRFAQAPPEASEVLRRNARNGTPRAVRVSDRSTGCARGGDAGPKRPGAARAWRAALSADDRDNISSAGAGGCDGVSGRAQRPGRPASATASSTPAVRSTCGEPARHEKLDRNATGGSGHTCRSALRFTFRLQATGCKRPAGPLPEPGRGTSGSRLEKQPAPPARECVREVPSAVRRPACSLELFERGPKDAADAARSALRADDATSRTRFRPCGAVRRSGGTDTPRARSRP
jgi:hypothetical protein